MTVQEAYLGFIVRRPIPGTPFGRTALRWYPDQTPRLPRVVDPSREYTCHVAGVELKVRGLAWQQQDAGVGACATIALWSMLHSSALDDRHVIPTTAEITQTAYKTGLSADPLFPSNGLNFSQIVATVRDSGFAPLTVGGDLDSGGFNRERFCASYASLVRSGYPVLIVGELEGGHGWHATCGVGFRQAAARPVPPGAIEFEDVKTKHIYVHDDNLGPAVRLRVEAEPPGGVMLRPDPPMPRNGLSLPDPTKQYPGLCPTLLVAAAHDDVRVTPDQLHRLALTLGRVIVEATGKKVGVSLGSRVTRLAEYAGAELNRVLEGRGEVLAKARMALWERVAPMSLHLGVVRLGVGALPLLDVLYDTTDSEPNMRAFCHVAYHSSGGELVRHLASLHLVDCGPLVEAY